MKVFITGATGLVGGAALRALVAAGHEVTGLTSRPANASVLEKLGARAMVGDMRDAKTFASAVGESDAVVHAAAAMPDKSRYTQADVDTLMIADEDAVNALISVLTPKCRAFVFTSGAWCYGDTGPVGVDETRSTAGTYAASARRANFEQVLFTLAKDGKVPAVIARPGLIYGRASLWQKLYLSAMKQKKRAMMTGNGNNTISFIHEDDVGNAYRVLVEKGVPGEAYNVADDAPARLRDVVNAQAHAMGAPPPRAVPGFLVRLAAGRFSAPPLLGDCALSNAKLKALGFVPKYPTYHEGVVAVAQAALAT